MPGRADARSRRDCPPPRRRARSVAGEWSEGWPPSAFAQSYGLRHQAILDERPPAATGLLPGDEDGSMARNIKAQRGNLLRCKGWRQESILRMLENNLENGEDPENLVIYTGARAARSWEDYDRIVGAL